MRRNGQPEKGDDPTNDAAAAEDAAEPRRAGRARDEPEAPPEQDSETVKRAKMATAFIDGGPPAPAPARAPARSGTSSTLTRKSARGDADAADVSDATKRAKGSDDVPPSAPPVAPAAVQTRASTRSSNSAVSSAPMSRREEVEAHEAVMAAAAAFKREKDKAAIAARAAKRAKDLETAKEARDGGGGPPDAVREDSGPGRPPPRAVTYTGMIRRECAGVPY